MDLYVIRRPSAWTNLQELEAAGPKSAKIGNEEMQPSLDPQLCGQGT